MVPFLAQQLYKFDILNNILYKNIGYPFKNFQYWGPVRQTPTPGDLVSPLTTEPCYGTMKFELAI